MMEDKIIEVSETSLAQARRHARENNDGRAFAHFLVYLELCPSKRESIQHEFIDVFLNWINLLKSRRRNLDLFNCIQTTLTYFPLDPVILTNAAKHFMAWDLSETALTYIETALSSRPTYLPAQKLHNAIKNALMPRWHIRMLNDACRNEAFKQAITKKIKDGYNKVLDIGTGTGLFSMYACKSNYDCHVKACDYSIEMFKLAQEILEVNDCKVDLMNRKSTDLSIEKFNLIIAEIFDSGVFGEDMIPTLIHAWENLLEPGGKIIPSSLEINIVGLECTELAAKHRFQNSPNIELELPSEIVNCESIPYETEDIFNLSDYKYVTTPADPWKVDLTNVDQLKQIMNGETLNLNLIGNVNGRIDAFMLWFQINLDEEIYINNQPCETNQNCCWEPAIFYLDEPIQVSPFQNVPILLTYNRGMFTIKPMNAPIPPDIYRVSPSCIKYLNDNELIESLNKSAQHFTHPPKTILDLAPFPYLGLVLLKQGESKLFCLTKSKTENDLLIRVCKLNNINEDKIVYVAKPIECKNVKFDLININFLQMEGELDQEIMSYAPIFKEMLEPNGIILPSCVRLHGILVDSDWFRRVAVVNDSNTGGVKVADFINKYKTDEQLDFSLQNIKYTALTEPNELFCINMDASIMEEVIHDVSVSVRANGTANAIAYWFEVYNLENKHNTGPSNKFSYVNNAAFLLDPEVGVTTSSEIIVQVTEYTGLLRLALRNILPQIER